jgi:glycosyltransferase involved in cell wall biosynthesis
MTHLMTDEENKTFLYRPEREEHFSAPSLENFQAHLAIVVPVKDNQEGIEKLLESFLDNCMTQSLPKTIVIVDNNSKPKIDIPAKFYNSNFSIDLIQCEKIGPAAARNAGWRYAQTHFKTQWTLFVDSDCRFDSASLKGYVEASNGSVAYQGVVAIEGNDWLSDFYREEKILVPREFNDKNFQNEEEPFKRPNYLITANTLVWNEALEKVGGFREIFPQAAGEDIALGWDLQKIGQLSFADKANIRHRFLEHSGTEVTFADMTAFISRFERYGKGNKILADLFPHVQGSLPKTLMHETEYQKLKHSLIVSSSLSRFEGKLSVSELSEFSKYALSIGYNLHPSGRLKSPTEVGCVDSPLSGPVGLTLSHGQTKI